MKNRKTIPVYKHSALILTSNEPLATKMSKVLDQIDCQANTFANLIEFGRISRLGNYDIIFVDYDMDTPKANEIAEYIEIFFKYIPVIILTVDRNLQFRNQAWSACVKAILTHKNLESSFIKQRLREISAL